MSSTGLFIAVVGPSGAGKDTLINGARKLLGSEGRFHFARRFITRPQDAGEESHMELSPEQFLTLRDDGGMSLWWSAHGHSYGLSAGVRGTLYSGRHVVANISRDALSRAVDRFASVHIIHVSANDGTIAERLALRGREDASDRQLRLNRQVDDWRHLAPVTEIVNQGTVREGISAFVNALGACTGEFQPTE